jgi:predicted dehydrogenase
MRTDKLARRDFLRGAASTAVAAALPAIIPASARGAARKPAPSNRIAMGCIGLGGRGTVNMRQFLKRDDVQIVALCDVDEGSRRYEDRWYRGLAPATETVEKKYAEDKASGRYKGCATYTDFRELVARDDIDAVVVSTPDHWHALITIAAAKSGKDVYCEKPLSHNIADGRAMVEAVTRYGRVFQCGSQRRSEARWRRSCELVRNGRIGKLQTIRVGLPGGFWLRDGSHAPQVPTPVPDGFHYDLWLGPAPWAPYTPARCHWNFRWNLDYSGGNVTDWGAHFIDMAQWGMGTEETGPVEIEGRGEFPPDGALWNAATSYRFECTYAEGMKLIVRSGGGGVRWEGTDGWIDGTSRMHPESIADSEIGADEIHLYESNSQHGNFIDCVKSRERTAAPCEVAHRSISVAHLGNIAMRTGRRIQFDPAKEEILGDPGAAALLGRAGREPWVL